MEVCWWVHPEPDVLRALLDQVYKLRLSVDSRVAWLHWCFLSKFIYIAKGLQYSCEMRSKIWDKTRENKMIKYYYNKERTTVPSNTLAGVCIEVKIH